MRREKRRRRRNICLENRSIDCRMERKKRNRCDDQTSIDQINRSFSIDTTFNHISLSLPLFTSFQLINSERRRRLGRGIFVSNEIIIEEQMCEYASFRLPLTTSGNRLESIVHQIRRNRSVDEKSERKTFVPFKGCPINLDC